MKTRFHVSLPCRHIAATSKFYSMIIGSEIGRAAQNWVDVDLFGHQITFIKSRKFNFDYPNYTFDKTILPSFHFGIILPRNQWQEMYQRMKTEDYLFIDATQFLKKAVGEHDSFFLRDPNGYIIEFKCFSKENEVFRS